MCGISGFCRIGGGFDREPERWLHCLESMNSALKRRGPDDEGIWLGEHCGMGHVRLSIIDPVTGHQPMTCSRSGRTCSLVMNGEIYNMMSLRRELRREGAVFETESDTEVVLQGYMLHGVSYLEKLNGIFAIALWDSACDTFYLFRDRMGIKPLFYTMQDSTLIFASEIKGLLAFPGINAVLDQEGLCEIFALGPARTPGKGVFRGMFEVLPGHYLAISRQGLRDICYWKLHSCPHEDSFSDTVQKTSYLVEDAVKLQMLSDTPICTFLSGGVDSSIVTAICSREMKKQGKLLDTFSFDFEGNGKYFQANAFQPSRDRPYVEKMVKFCGTNHRFLECGNSDMISCLYDAVRARDLPCMADVESSMLYFCSKVAEHDKVALTGECADEIFGGYPWFHTKEAFETDAFPWSQTIKPRQALLSDELIESLPMEEYARAAYEQTIRQTPVCTEDSITEKRRREIAWLNLRWFMVTLLDRMDRTSMYSGLEARVPLADHRIVEYIWNVPWNMKCPEGTVKGLLRHAAEGWLPDEILWRRKSPYPKTYHPDYEKALGKALLQVLEDPNAPLRTLVDPQKVHAFLESSFDYGRPWYGQLMAGPQMLAYLLQVNYWLKEYRIRIV